MKEYGNKIEIAILDDISSIDGTTINMVEGKSVIQVNSSNDIIPDEQPGNSDGSVFYTQKMNVVTDKLSTTDRNNLLDRKVVVKLFYTDSSEVLIGSMTNPARCNSQPYLNQDTLKISCDSPIPLLS